MANPLPTNAALSGAYPSTNGSEEVAARAAEESRRETRSSYPWDRCVHQLFEAQVTRTPDAVAVEWGAESLSYVELNALADRIADHLRGLGVRPDVRVGICLERSLEMIAGLVGILKAGG